MKNKPQIGVGVIVTKDDKVLLGKRKSSHGTGTWSFGGGHLEFGESIEDCARREIMEEVGINIKNIQNIAFTNDFFDTENKHYVTLFVTAEYKSGEVCRMEPDKCEIWDWFEWDKLPRPLFLPIENLLSLGYNPFK
ncbi:MAG: NUDIX domain-containing protein [Candidatus Magasanikbacteria bacterium]|nr:NUDIX domain-containing protein [Candidatus Magasanikbacteria bacterium]